MRDEAALWDLEERFWTGGLDGARAATAQDAVMIFPYPEGILQGGEIWERLKRKTPWRSVEMTGRSLRRRGDLAVLAYRVSAEKAAAPILTALCASAYLRDNGTWIRMSHQQTPVS
ncbi:DUF4440 domain-containing protein [Leisingera methylohalidivorans]|uniref:DUF4440 domain-containing protein n=1 Tax=Leisingera methylohalidivorans DSM 14336 TaxID=999552 RepID=V9VUA6_9RHOB|nr:DUF4440 domain-containing protein [Leisingera methylohalidivorans]AHD00900.1 hypothetical protein METH_09610 [Leisingera methylohalidivorans DSM 14336]